MENFNTNFARDTDLLKRVDALESEILILRSEVGRLQNSMWRMQGHSNPVNVNPYEVKGRIRR